MRNDIARSRSPYKDLFLSSETRTALRKNVAYMRLGVIGLNAETQVTARHLFLFGGGQG